MYALQTSYDLTTAYLKKHGFDDDLVWSGKLPETCKFWAIKLTPIRDLKEKGFLVEIVLKQGTVPVCSIYLVSQLESLFTVFGIKHEFPDMPVVDKFHENDDALETNKEIHDMFKDEPKKEQQFIEDVWNKLRVVDGPDALDSDYKQFLSNAELNLSPDMFRLDACGAIVMKSHYGNLDNMFGWCLNKTNPNGSIDISNIRGMNVFNAHAKHNDYPSYFRKVVFDGEYNVVQQKVMVIKEANRTPDVNNS